MARVAVVVTLVVFSALFAGCEMQETRKVHKSSLEQQFATLNKNGWNVSGAESAAQKPAAPTREMKVIREADFSNLTFKTNFQVDDPKLKEEQAKRERDEAAKRGPAPENSAPVATPFGTLTPGK